MTIRALVEHVRACIDRGLARTLRFYAAELVFLAWAVIVGLGIGQGSQVIAGVRLATLAVALGISFREVVRINSERARRNRRRDR